MLAKFIVALLFLLATCAVSRILDVCVIYPLFERQVVGLRDGVKATHYLLPISMRPEGIVRQGLLMESSAIAAVWRWLSIAKGRGFTQAQNAASGARWKSSRGCATYDMPEPG